jgi:RHS repeat-associated protein
VARYEYDARGDLVRVTDVAGPAVAYQYDAAGLMTSELRRGGAAYSFSYDTQGRCIYTANVDGFEQRTLRYDDAARETHVTDSKGATTIYAHNEAGQITLIVTALGTTARYGYDDLGRPKRWVDANGNASEVRYDGLGRLIAASYPDGRELQLEWNERHLVSATTDVEGRRWTYDYDELGLLERTRNPLGDEHRYINSEYAERLAIVAPNGASERFVWDQFGNLAQRIGPDGPAWQYQHDAYGRQLARHDPDGALTRWEYDALGNVTALIGPDGSRTEYGFDQGQRCVLERYADGTTLRRSYNACGSVIEVINTDGGRTELVWDTEPGRLLAFIDPNKNRVEYEYDLLGRPVRRRNFDGAEYRFEYDPRGNLAALIDAAGQRFTYEYDAWNEVIKRTTPDGVVTRYEHDHNGVLTVAERDDYRLEYQRDLYGRVTAEIHNGVAVRSGYDVVGNRIKIESDLGLSIETQFTPGCQCRSIDAFGRRVEFERDLMGRELRRTLAGAGEFHQRFDSLGRIVDQWYLPPGYRAEQAQVEPSIGGPAGPLRRKLEHDSMGRVTSIHDSLRGHRSFLHDAVGRLRATIGQRGRAEYFAYDLNGNFLETAVLGGGAQPPPAQQVFAVDSEGRLRLDLGQLGAAGATSSSFELGAGNRTLSRRGADESIDYEYDANGRMVGKRVRRSLVDVIEQWRYEYNPLGELVAVVRPDGERWRYEYDPVGRRVAKHGPASSTRYVWDRSTLIHEQLDQRAPITYVHHPQHRTPMIRVEGKQLSYVLHDHLGGAAEAIDESGQLRWVNQQGTWGGEEHDNAFTLRFVGQWYDEESGLNYNLHRYYDPSLGKFTSQDPMGLLGGINDYAWVRSPLEWIDPDGLITGGPYDYHPTGSSAGGPPDIHGHREVINPNTGNPNTVRSPRPGEDAGGKTLAVVSGPDGTHTGFVSGHGNPQGTSHPGIGWDTSGHHYGNWCHAEIHAMAWLQTQPPGDYRLYIDRPPCGECSGSLGHALHDLPEGVNVEVWYHRTQPADGEEAGWHPYHGCG